MSTEITAQKKLEITQKTLEFLRKEIIAEGFVLNHARCMEEEVLMLAFHASTSTDTVRCLVGAMR